MCRALGLLLILIASCTCAAYGDGRAEEPGEHDFGDSIVVFTLEYEDDLLPTQPWALADAQVRRLGNVFFLTGTLPEGKEIDGSEAPPARRFWIPLADIVRIAEYEDVEAAREALEAGAGDEAMERQVAPGTRGRKPVPPRLGARAERLQGIGATGTVTLR